MDNSESSQIIYLRDGLEEYAETKEDTWRKRVSQTLKLLEDRITALEIKERSSHRPHDRPFLRLPTSFAKSGKYGLDGIPTCIRLLKKKRVARLQCTWLLVCVLVFTWIGIEQFVRARSNEESEWKPEKIIQVNDYGIQGKMQQYEMPNVYILFEAKSLEASNWNNQSINTVFDNLLVSQNYFNDSVGIGYVTASLQTIGSSLIVEEAKVVPLKLRSSTSFFGCFEIRLANPDKTKGSFWFWIHLAADKLTLNNKLRIVGFWVYVARDIKWLSTSNVVYLAGRDVIYKNETMSYNVKYTETIYKYLDNRKPYHHFNAELVTTDYAERWVGTKQGLSMIFRGNEIVETWAEYVDFSYTDWIISMGGMLSLVTFFFYFFAYHTAEMLSGNASLGILPVMSKVFRNLELLSRIKEELQDMGILSFKEVTDKDEDEL